MHGRAMTSPVSGRTLKLADPLLVCIASGRGWLGKRQGFSCVPCQSVSGLGGQLGIYLSLGSVLWLGHQDRAECLQQGWLWKTACQEVMQEPHSS